MAVERYQRLIPKMLTPAPSPRLPAAQRMSLYHPIQLLDGQGNPGKLVLSMALHGPEAFVKEHWPRSTIQCALAVLNLKVPALGDDLAG